MAGKRTPAARSRRRKDLKQVDVEALIKEPVRVGKDGRSQRMTAFEVSLRAQVKKALKERSLPAIKCVLDVARTYKLLMPAGLPLRNGVLVVQGRLTKESWAALFKKPCQDSGTDDKSK